MPAPENRGHEAEPQPRRMRWATLAALSFGVITLGAAIVHVLFEALL